MRLASSVEHSTSLISSRPFTVAIPSRYQVEFRCVGGSCGCVSNETATTIRGRNVATFRGGYSSWGAIFRVESIGKRAASGYDGDTRGFARSFFHSSEDCRTLRSRRLRRSHGVARVYSNDSGHRVPNGSSPTTPPIARSAAVSSDPPPRPAKPKQLKYSKDTKDAERAQVLAEVNPTPWSPAWRFGVWDHEAMTRG